MAYSPSPRPLGALGATQPVRHPGTPPIPIVISKQRKRRNALAERLKDISVSFAQNRDDHYRKQLQTLQLDMNHINHAQPYENAPLDDFSSDILEETNAAGPSTANEGFRMSMMGARMSDMEALPRSGSWFSRYTQEINDAMEEKDAQLTLVAERHNARIHALKADYEYGIQVAQEERKRLMEQIRERVVNQVSQRKALLMKEKHLLDIGDTSALLLHPNQFSLGNPASPGGPQSNRKTRHTRHRLEVDDLGGIADGNKRKRKAAADVEMGSPGPTSRTVLVDTPSAWKENQTKLETHQIAPSMSIDELFTDKDLTVQLQLASHAALDLISKRRKLNHEGQGSGAQSNADATESEDNIVDAGNSTFPVTNNTNPSEIENEEVFLTAPEMDRTANSSFYATRSTRIMSLNVPLASSSLPSDLAGRASIIPLLGTYNRERKSQEEYQRAPPLSDHEKDADLAMMAAAIRDAEKRPENINRKVIKDLCPQVFDYVSAAAVAKNDFGNVSNIRTEIVTQPRVMGKMGDAEEETLHE